MTKKSFRKKSSQRNNNKLVILLLPIFNRREKQKNIRVPPIVARNTRCVVGALLTLRIMVKERDETKGEDKGQDRASASYSPHERQQYHTVISCRYSVSV